jgi:hypothetical protein
MGRSSARPFVLFLCTVMVCGAVASGMPQAGNGIQVPVVGLVYDQDARALRAIMGLPGASVFSNPLPLAAEIANVHLAPGQSYAVVERFSMPMGLIKLSSASAGPVSGLPVDTVKPDLLAFNPAGTGVAIRSATDGITRVIKGLPDAPALVQAVRAEDLPAGVRYLALADDGRTLAAATDTAVYLVSENHLPTLLSASGNLGGMAFMPGFDSILTVDRDGGRVLLLQNVGSSPVSRVLATGLPSLEGEIALQIESGRAVVTSAASNLVRLIELGTGEIQNLELPSASTMAERLRTPHNLLLSYSTGAPAWVLDLSSRTSSVYFVPAQTSGVK